MKKILTAATAALMFLLLGTSLAVAQEDEDDGPAAVPVEAFACNYLDGKGPADLDSVIDEWNDWMDDEEVSDYFAVTLVPNFFGERNFDVAWLGAWTDGHAMGAGLDQWLHDSGDLPGKFWEVIDCTSHTSFVSIQLKERTDTGAEPDDSFVLSFSNCSFEGENGFEELMAAQNEWNAYADEHGFVSAAWMMFPIAGESDDSYDFKYLVSSPDHTTSGANWQLFSDGHWRKSDELFDSIVDCDISRVYDATVRRRIESDDD